MIDQEVVKMVLATTGGKIVSPRRVPVWEQWHDQAVANHVAVNESIEAFCELRKIPAAS